jgi:uncharacterized membrane protein YeaQ/YmgE (transglycosylase-associated protein family)
LLDNKIDINKQYHIQLPSFMSILITLCIGLIVGYLGPFGSYQMPLTQRLLYWVILIIVGNIIFSQSEKFCKWYFDKKQLNLIVSFILTSLVGSVFLTFFVEYMTHLFLGLQLANPDNFLFLFPKVFILGLTLNIVGYLLDQAKKNINQPQQRQTKDNLFINRIPDQLGSELICFCMEDHYLNVHTTKGSHMMLLRMKDALVELEDYNGFQVHRSWWVALDAIEDIKKQSRKATLIMKNGIEVPVSQKYLPLIKEAGLIS